MNHRVLRSAALFSSQCETSALSVNPHTLSTLPTTELFSWNRLFGSDCVLRPCPEISCVCSYDISVLLTVYFLVCGQARAATLKALWILKDHNSVLSP